MISITDEMQELINNSFEDKLPCLLGSASLAGRPQISPKGSVIVYDHETLAYWERARHTALRNVSVNPQVVVYYGNPEKNIHWRFHGNAWVSMSGEIRDKVMSKIPQQELNQDSEHRGAAVLIRVHEITQVHFNKVEVLQRSE